MKHIVTDIQRFCMHDGPGIRTTVFLKGCPLNCFWCHNPETKKAKSQLMFYQAKCIGCGACFACESRVHSETDGKHMVDFEKCIACGRCIGLCPTKALTMAGVSMESREIIDVVLKDKAFYGQNGGITLSGGEPMLNPSACIELLTLAKENGLNTAVETCGYFDKKHIEPLCKVTDLFLWDIKDTDDTRHKANTGVSNEKILKNLRLADRYGVPIILRCIMLKGINMNDEHKSKVKDIFASLHNGVRIDWLPCHSLGNSKAEAIGIGKTDLTSLEPSEEDVIAVRDRQ